MDKKEEVEEQKKTNWWLPIGLVILLVVFIGGLSWWQQNKTPKTNIKIGVIAPLTGVAALYGQGSLDMINMAVEEINKAGGIDGRNLSVVAEDGKCQADQAVIAANKLIQTDKVKFILGGHCSSETAIIAPILDKNKVFGLAGVSTAPGILDKYSYVFRTSPSSSDQSAQIAQLAYNTYNLKTIATITEQTAYAKGITDDFIKDFVALGGTIIDSEEYASGQAGFQTELTKIKAAKPDALFVSPQGQPTAIEIAKEIKTLNITGTLLGNSVFVGKTVYAQSGNALPDGTFTVAPYANLTSKNTAALISKYNAKYGKDIPYNNFFVGAAYDGVYMLKNALVKCGEDSTCVKDYFSSIKDYNGSVATFSFKSNGDADINNWYELKLVGGKEVYSKVQ
ncbi:hypothetical protein COT78_02795 [Candidatus Berkelbacteria bacterium CG10_big_fil_rev_8_21_14_0_10_43_13]|uniref:Leucine-binding protein domain-containing protein n=1 Tax=Candidatus Berkelbacteria bacterium CG10_big_fil_rev_8_21_14_0_10_43_13 TaxID=1974514 RepID=A0A2H0W6A5_9BACT|nr:MAG: hypothetical protein COT78_02795 [Candidatus Berkelbacteria bacterium CG10_big_fil_rev_8_21_14_0_10_43_13]